MAERKNGQPRRVYGHKEEASCRTWCSGADRGHLALGQEVTQLGPLRWGQLAGCKQQQTHRVHENNNHTVCREINERIDELTGGLITLCFGGGFGGSGVQLGFEQSVPQALQLPVQTAFTTSKQSTI